MTFNSYEVQFCREEIEFLGFILTTKVLRIDPKMVEAIQNDPRPRNVKQLKGFWGLTNFCSRYAEKLAVEVEQLLKLLHKGVKWQWAEEHDVAFARVEELFKNQILLYHPVRNKEFILYTDGSLTALGAALYQYDKHNELQRDH